VETLARCIGIVLGCKAKRNWVLLQRAVPFCQTSLVFRGKGCRRRSLKTGSNIIKDILNKESEQPVGNSFKTRFSEAKGNLEDNINKMTRSGLGLKRKRKLKKAQSQGKRRKVKDIFTE